MKPRKHTLLGGSQSTVLTEIDVAEQLLVTAIQLFFEGARPVPIYSLASAAREIATTLAEKTGSHSLTAGFAQVLGVSTRQLAAAVHRHAAFFKHADRDPDATLEFVESEVDAVLMFACEDLAQVVADRPVEVVVFQMWYVALTWKRVSEAPLKIQPLVKGAIKAFPGLRTAPTREERKAIGLNTLKIALSDPSLKRTMRREEVSSALNCAMAKRRARQSLTASARTQSLAM